MKPKISSLILFAAFVCIHASAQLSVSNQKVAGGSLNEILTASIPARDGGLIVAGSSNSNVSGEKTTNSRGGYDYWVIKYNISGAIEWTKTIGGSSDDILTCIQQTNDGGYLLGGYSQSGISGEKTENSRKRNDYWIVKLDSLSNIEWDKTIGGNNQDYLQSLQQTRDGGYILGGFSKSDISGEKTDYSRDSSNDYWIVKLDSLHNIEWDKTIGGNAYDQLNSVQQTKDGGYILGGFSESKLNFEKTDTCRGIFDYWLVKTDSLGTIQWDKTMGGSRKDVLTSLVLTNDGGYFLAGYSYSKASGEKTSNNRGTILTTDYWVVKLDSLHNIQWDKTFGGNFEDTCTFAIQTADSGYLLAGYSRSDISFEKTENSKGGYDYWVVKINKSGNVQWDKTIGGFRDDYLETIRETSRNNYELYGYSASGSSGDKTESSRGGTDFWTLNLTYTPPVKAIAPTSVTENNITLTNSLNTRFSVYPNPAKDMVYIQADGKATVSLINQAGKQVFTKKIENNGFINIAGFTSGLYYLKNNATGQVLKIIIVK